MWQVIALGEVEVADLRVFISSSCPAPTSSIRYALPEGSTPAPVPPARRTSPRTPLPRLERLVGARARPPHRAPCIDRRRHPSPVCTGSQALRKRWDHRAAEERARGAIRRRCTIYCRFRPDFVPGAGIDVEAARGLLLAGGRQPLHQGRSGDRRSHRDGRGRPRRPRTDVSAATMACTRVSAGVVMC